jgi:WD40 repeat protein
VRIVAPGTNASLRVLTLAIVRAALLAVLLLAVQAAPALASFPGENGKIAYEAYVEGNYDIYLVNPDGSANTRLTTDPASDSRPAWSPDGREIAFVSFRNEPNPTNCYPSCNSEIYVMNADGTNVRRVTDSPGIDTWPSWSPDGTRLAFQRGEPSLWEIWTVAPDGSGLSFVTAGHDDGCPVYASAPDWSPAGDYIAFASHNMYPCGENTAIALVHPDGTGSRLLTSLSNLVGLDWSPDAQRLSMGNNSTAFIYELDDGTRSAIYENGADFVVWSPDGTKLLLRSGGMFTVNPDGTGRQDVPALGGFSGFGVDWQPILKGYPRPKAATPLYISLVPAYQACTSGSATKTHAPPLAFGSCTAAQTSNQLTVGSFDANGKTANSTAYIRAVRLGDLTTPADDSDVKLVSLITDVRNKADLTDYTGELQAKLDLRITDKLNTPYPGGPGPGTVADTTFSFTVPCAPNSDPAIGSQCFLDTTADTVLPGIAPENRRVIWQTDQVKVYDGGPDGDADTAPNTLFMAQGVFAP